ncbi:hypothetical protein ASD11_02710 [Aeromicrobium sp. Root495]|uniref:GDSL-type esterase/lipase family protein n=1 Tax=Aeromicrobium sp. Root495 TaxID=1736550 RepID=UPI0006F4F7DA|nr:GDSL-type esterase/lipase family protein [Aeromicrobium sp. Root495]KQY58586.1 hypothetical protein ASD11_02710 [Aeromicrobium sp. Root495]
MKLLPRLTAVAVVASALALPTIAATTSPAAAAVTHRVLITGDSITQGSSGDYTWRYRLWNKLAGTASGRVAFVGTRTDLYDNVGRKSGSQHYAASFSARSHSARWGDTYVDELDSIASQVSASKATTLVTMLGSNDLAYKTSPGATLANVKTYIQRARKARPGLDVVVGEVVNRYDPWAGTYSLNDESGAYATKLRALASSLSTSSQRVVVASTRNGWDAQKHTWDGTHPNPTGEKLIAQRVSEGLAKIGVGKASPDITGTTAWKVAGPRPSLTPASEAAKLGWTRSSTGATGMFIEQRLINTKEAWRRLPYAVAGSGWTAQLLAAGGTYQYRLVPSKGSSTGVVGAAASVKTTGPMPGSIPTLKVVAGNGSIYGGHTAEASWATSKNATGYKLATRLMSNGKLTWAKLPYAITDRDWMFEPLKTGRRYKLRILPVRGYLSGPSKISGALRLKGVPSGRTYVALGDSYSAGLGSSGKYTGGECMRSAKGWVWQMQHSFNAVTKHLACSGAVIKGPSGYKSVTNQLTGLKSSLAAHKGRPQLVTLTVGGNDVGFASVLKRCTFGSSCTGEEAPRMKKIRAMRDELHTLYKKIKKAAPYADIVVGGYPRVLEVNGTSKNALCQAVGTNERAMAARLTVALNSEIAQAAGNAGVWAMKSDLMDTFDGHGACATTGEWIHAGKRDVGGQLGIVSAASFHPKDAGQLAYAKYVSDLIIGRAK